MPIVIPYTDEQVEFAVNMDRFARTLLYFLSSALTDLASLLLA